MNTKELQLVTFEQARRLRAIGFDWFCEYYYNEGDIKNLVKFYCRNHSNSFQNSTPTVALALKWFRDVKGIIANIGYDVWLEPLEINFIGSCYLENGRRYINIGKFDTYEDAESALLDKLLNILEKKQ